MAVPLGRGRPTLTLDLLSAISSHADFLCSSQIKISAASINNGSNHSNSQFSTQRYAISFFVTLNLFSSIA
ncbi:hypothetical protein V2G26_004095 [Clonostachys chloroleuca]